LKIFAGNKYESLT